MKPKKKRKPASTKQKLSPEDEILVTALIRDLPEKTPQKIIAQIPSPILAQALIERLPANEEHSAPLISAIGETFKEKNVQKAFKKAIYRFKKKGILIQASENAGATDFVIKSAEREDPVGLLGAVDGTGTRGVFLAIPQIPKGFDVGLGVVSDEMGMVQFFFDTCSKKQMKKIEQGFRSEIMPVVEATVSHVVTVLENIYQLYNEDPGKIPSDYISMRSRFLKATPPLERPPIYDLMADAEIKTESITHSRLEKLFSHVMMASWVIPHDEVEPLLAKIKEVNESPILLSAAQKADRIRVLKDEWLEESLGLNKQKALKNRLEEMAYIFYKLEEPDYALLALSSGKLLDEEYHLFKENIFVKFLLDRSIRIFGEMNQTQQKPDEVIDKPDSSIILS